MKRAPRPSLTDLDIADVYIGGPHVEDVLKAELLALGAAGAADVSPGVVVTRPGTLLDPAFARQVMPSAQRIAVELAGSAGTSALAAAVLDVVPAGVSLGGDDVEVIVPEVQRRGSGALENHPLEGLRGGLADVLQAKVLGRRAKHGDTTPPSGHRVRVLLIDNFTAWVSVGRAPSGPALLAWPSPFPGGRAVDERAANAPSSAHRKLDEALAWLEMAPGVDDIVLDLGAAPGGWSWAALQRGSRVIAVDRAQLDAEIAKHPRLEHVRADAFKYVPERQPTWLLCDVIAEPERSLEVVERALTSSHLRGLVVTLKLKRPVKLDVVKRARAICKSSSGFFGRTKSLAANKLEVTVMMRRA